MNRRENDNTIGSLRRQVSRVFRMKQRQLENGIVVHYIYEKEFGMPHFEFFSHTLSSTGYRSDFFGSYGQSLSEDEILEAFDIRANIHYRNCKMDLEQEARENRRSTHPSGQLSFGF